MAARNKPYDQFGPYILFKKLEADALGDSWRAGRIDGTQLGATVALRRFTGGQRNALAANAQAVEPILPTYLYRYRRGGQFADIMAEAGKA